MCPEDDDGGGSGGRDSNGDYYYVCIYYASSVNLNVRCKALVSERLAEGLCMGRSKPVVFVLQALYDTLLKAKHSNESAL